MALTHLDAGVVIGLLDGNDAHHNTARAALTEATARGDRLAMSAAAFAEVLVGPARRDAEFAVVRELFSRLPIEVSPVSEDVALTAARLRAAHQALRLPDALVIATAVVERADRLITTDRRWPSARALRINTALTRL